MTDTTAAPAPITVALVHGAFADSSGWSGVVEELQAEFVSVQAIINPLRGISHDTDYVASALGQIPGRVLAVGHSYGGAIITNAATRAGNVVGLVYVAAFAPDEGEVLGDITAGSKDSVLNTALVELQYPSPDGHATEYAIHPDHFHHAFAADVSETEARVMAAVQRPVAAAAFTEKSGPPAWKELPSWAIVAGADTAAGADVVRAMAKRANATSVEVDASHVVMVSQPAAVTAVIHQALEALT
ncbi:alpha/beta hydrolase [Terrabacter sp. Soil811]|uniref:alpha/beta fold hydrolase n=1 Tax=Terrabacter sp. Soil811 TaxID=1736419 RepID=UPI0006FA60B0|nr:alpha/beta hydrolase [Terrabacter sp. Soil811]KRF46462.1 alpha/beta hydrolase [Terrabacter sp. Soil811]